MCMAVYLAADVRPPLVAWDKTRPSFTVMELTSKIDRAVRAQFSKPYVVYVGSHEGCGCGFNYGQYPDLHNHGDETENRRSVAALASYVGNLLSKVEEVEVFSCWEGDQGGPVESRRTVGLPHLGGVAFRFRERELLRIVK